MFVNNCEEVSKALADLIAGEKDKAEEKNKGFYSRKGPFVRHRILKTGEIARFLPFFTFSYTFRTK